MKSSEGPTEDGRQEGLLRREYGRSSEQPTVKGRIEEE